MDWDTSDIAESGAEGPVTEDVIEDNTWYGADLDGDNDTDVVMAVDADGVGIAAIDTDGDHLVDQVATTDSEGNVIGSVRHVDGVLHIQTDSNGDGVMDESVIVTLEDAATIAPDVVRMFGLPLETFLEAASNTAEEAGIFVPQAGLIEGGFVTEVASVDLFHGDGIPDAAVVTVNIGGVEHQGLAADATGDGIANVIVVDIDGDGIPETVMQQDSGGNWAFVSTAPVPTGVQQPGRLDVGLDTGTDTPAVSGQGIQYLEGHPPIRSDPIDSTSRQSLIAATYQTAEITMTQAAMKFWDAFYDEPYPTGPDGYAMDPDPVIKEMLASGRLSIKAQGDLMQLWKSNNSMVSSATSGFLSG